MHAIRRALKHLPLLALALTGASFFTACSESHSLPTEPAPLAVTDASVTGQATVEGAETGEPRRLQRAVAGERAPFVEREGRSTGPAGALRAEAALSGPISILAEARGGNGKGGNGGGKGDGGKGGGGKGDGGGKGGGGKGGDLGATIQPDVWNTNWEHSAGTVSVVIRGSGLDQVDADSIRLVGTDGAAEALEPVRVQVTRTQIRAFFAKSDALATLDTPERGETHEVKIELTVGETDEEKTLTDKVRIVGPNGDDDDDEGEDELEAQIQPDTWNTNWVGSAGTVSVKITGDGLGDVDLSSIVLVGTDADAEPLPALRASKNGNHIRAFFAKSDAIKTLDTPTAGERHEILIRLSAADAETELKDTIRVVGPGH